MPKPESGRFLQAVIAQVVFLTQLTADLPVIGVGETGDCPYLSYLSYLFLFILFILHLAWGGGLGGVDGPFLNTAFQSTRPVAIMITSSVRIATITIERPV